MTRSSLYKLLEGLLSYPGDWLKFAWKKGEVDDLLSPLIEGLPYTIATPELTARGFESVNMESEYLRLFELPVDGDPCPLYIGVYADNRHEVMEELLRYYRFFGLSTVKANTQDLPDSIPTLLEFLQFLAYKESIATDPEETAAVRLAQHDLLERHLTCWLPSILGKLQDKRPIPFYRDVIQLLYSFTSAELQLLAN